jgi:2-keto-3-deoxy-L-rhamnonate aldolase RhmA
MRETIRPNAIAAAIRTGTPARGFHMSIAVPAQIELLGGLGFDFVFLDAEHGSFDLAGVENCCRAAELYGLTVVARVAACDGNLISQVLNAGVQGIVVPHVDTLDQARLAIAACRYAPDGLRPSGGARSNGFWRGISDMAAAVHRANAEVTLSVQIESQEGLAALPALLDLDGIDYFTVGKQDLAQSMGFTRLGTGWPAEVVAAAKAAAGLVHAAGGKMKDDVMALCRVNQMMVAGAKAFLTGKAAQ